MRIAFRCLIKPCPHCPVLSHLGGDHPPPCTTTLTLFFHRGCDNFQRWEVALCVAFLALDCHLALHGGDGGGAGGAACPKNVRGGVGVDVWGLTSRTC
jgi:hypothetical protein